MAWRDFNISSATFDNKQAQVRFLSSFSGGLRDIFFKPDGTRIYVQGADAAAILQLDLAIAWDLDSVIYSTNPVNYKNLFVINSLFSTTEGIWFKPDGTKLYIVSQTAPASIYAFDLSTPWDINTINYTGENLSVNGLTGEASTQGIVINTDGTKIYIVGTAGTDRIYQFELLTPWDLSSVGGTIVTYDISGQDTSNLGLYITDDGLTIFVVGARNDYVYKYIMSSAWDLTTASYSGTALTLSGLSSSPAGIFFSSNGSKMYIAADAADAASPPRVLSFSLSSNWDITTAIYDNIYLVGTGQDTTPYSIQFKPDGTKMYMSGAGNNLIFEYVLTTAWDISTLSYNKVSLSITGVRGMFFKDDGTRLFVVNTTTDVILQYNLSTPWDLSTASYAGFAVAIGSQTTVPVGIFIGSNGSKLYVIQNGSTGFDGIFQYTLITPWHLGNVSYDNIYLDVSAQEIGPNALFFSEDGIKLYVTGGVSDRVRQYTLSTPWDISTATYDGNSYYFYNTFSSNPNVTGLCFKPNGMKFYLCETQTGIINQYSTASNWNFNLNDTVSLTEQNTNIRSRIIDVSETVALNELEATANTIFGDAVDTLYLSEEVSILRLKMVLVFDSLTLGENPTDAPYEIEIVSRFQDRIRVRWTTKILGAKKMLIRYKTSDYPTDTEDGTHAYFGEDNDVTITGLQPNTKYYFRIWGWRNLEGYSS